MPDIVVSPAARADLLAQWHYFANEIQDLALADRFVLSAQQTFNALARSPGLGRPRSFPESTLKNLRSRRIDNFPKHLVFYRPLPRKRGVQIVRVLHGMRDLDSILAE